MHFIRAADDRGRTQLDWLDSRHSFSFGRYYDPGHMGFGTLRVINEDRVVPGGGFATHPHQDMEILSWVVEGAMEHEDSTGSGGTIRPGELQRMTAGSGVTHSEFNASDTQPLHFLQVWLLPEEQGLQPSYEQIAFAPSDLQDQLHLIASRSGHGACVKVHQDVSVYAARLSTAAKVTHTPTSGRRLWLQVVRGAVEVDDRICHAGDGAAWIQAESTTISAREPSEMLLFDLAR